MWCMVTSVGSRNRACTIARMALINWTVNLQGIILATRDRFTKGTEGGGYAGNVTSAAGYLLALWLHECRRVFADKLTSHEDKEWVDETVFKLINENCGPDLVSQVRMGNMVHACRIE